MSDFKHRLSVEKTELDDRIDKLQAFQGSESFRKIPSIQQTLLNIQVHAMITYSQILLERIVLLE